MRNAKKVSRANIWLVVLDLGLYIYTVLRPTLQKLSHAGFLNTDRSLIMHPETLFLKFHSNCYSSDAQSRLIIRATDVMITILNAERIQ
jgi:hypothetical protein